VADQIYDLIIIGAGPGSTLEACAQVLLKIPGTTVSIATIACA